MDRLSIVASLAILASFEAAWADASPVPPQEAAAKAALNASPRHGEMVDIAVPGADHGTTILAAWVVPVLGLYGADDARVTSTILPAGYPPEAPTHVRNAHVRGRGPRNPPRAPRGVILTSDPTIRRIAPGVIASPWWAVL